MVFYGVTLLLRAALASRAILPARVTTPLEIPSGPPARLQKVPANYQSYSIEFSYMADFAGNKSFPNKFSKQMLQNLKDISGELPIIRAGGSTSDRATFYPNQTASVLLTFSTPGADQPSSMTIGPTWIESFQQFPDGTKYIYSLNFNDGAAGLNQTVLEATNAFLGIGENIFAFEIGNEVEGWAGTRRPSNWTLQSYVDQFLQYANAIGNEAIGSSLDARLEPLFQGGAITAPRNLAISPTIWNVANMVRDGIAKTGRVRSASDHEYMGSNCHGSTPPTIESNILNHTHMATLMHYHAVLADYVSTQGVDYVIGETNSISCQGTTGVSDVYATSLWGIDYILYGATTNVSRMYYHMGTVYRYSPWQPITLNGTAAHVKPLYYGNLFTSTALAGGDKQVVTLLNGTTLTAYAIYTTSGTKGSGLSTPKLEHIAVINMAVFSSIQPASSRTSETISLPSGTANWSEARVARLTAPGVDVVSGITFAGQSVDSDGHIVGQKALEKVNDGQVSVAAGEAVLISL